MMKNGNVSRQTVDLSAYPDLVVVYLGMRVNAFAGLKTVIGIGPRIAKSVEEKPDGLLCHEQIFYGIFPFHIGMRQYWRDFESMEAWTRSAPHVEWWKKFLKDSGGTGFWHETYMLRGGFEAIYLDLAAPIGLGSFAPLTASRGSMFSARRRLGLQGELPSPLSEDSLYPVRD
jgi:hypothetical protein